MTKKNRRVDPNLESDPFAERTAFLTRGAISLLGGKFIFQSNSEELLALVDAAYAGLPDHLFSSASKTFRINLLLTPKPVPNPIRRAARRVDPPPISMLQGAGFLGSATPSSTFVVLHPENRAGLVSASPEMLRFPYHVRYELIEFAVFTLACRAQGLVPLHGACVGLDGRGVLLMGPSGSGKSTVALQCLLEGLDFVSEDSVFVAPNSMRATGTPNFLHVREDSLHWVEQLRIRSMIRKSPVIRRRSGVEKFEVDLRRKEFRLAKTPLRIIGVVFLSPRLAGTGPLLRPLSAGNTLARLKEEQAYGASLPQWATFNKKLLRLGGFEVFRGPHPSASVEALRSLLVKDDIKSHPSSG
ncbi:MAG: serine kinase [Pseudomonadota bacterium]|nr:serine kinase [Pseudomonadota bacterium]